MYRRSMLLMAATLLFGAASVSAQTMQCDVLQSIEKERLMLDHSKGDLRFDPRAERFQEIFIDHATGTRSLLLRGNDYKWREISVVLLNANTCELVQTNIVRELRDNLITKIHSGETGVIVDGPVHDRTSFPRTHLQWWEVEFRSGLRGWISGSLLVGAAGNRRFDIGETVRVGAATANIRKTPGVYSYPHIGIDDPRLSVRIEERVYGALWNGFNTPFAVSPDEWVVVANTWKAFRRDLYLVYTPFSYSLYRVSPYREIAWRGQEHYERDMRKAFDELRRLNVRSRAIPGRLAADVVEEHFYEAVRLVAIIEQSDPNEMHAYRQGITPYSPFLRMQFIIGTNDNIAFGFTTSSAGARGITQIWSATCSRMRLRTYPSAGLPAGCGAAADPAHHGHVESIKAAILHFDMTLESFINAFGPGIVRHPQITRLQLAAYNGSVSRAIYSFRHHGPTWDSHRCSRCLQRETMLYLEKYDFLKAHPSEVATDP